MTTQRQQPASCSHVVDPVLGKQCSERFPLFDAYRREGTGMYFNKTPYVRCGAHLIELVSRLARWDYDLGYLDMVVRHGEQIGPQREALK